METILAVVDVAVDFDGVVLFIFHLCCCCCVDGDIDRPVVVVAVFVVVGFALLIIQTKLMRDYD